MKCIEPNEMYYHRGQFMIRYHMDRDGCEGIGTEEDDCLFGTFADARRYIDKRHDGSHDKEPVVTGHWNAEFYLMHKYGMTEDSVLIRRLKQ